MHSIYMEEVIEKRNKKKTNTSTSCIRILFEKPVRTE